MPSMDTREAIKHWLINAPEAARLAGKSLHTIRAIRDGKRVNARHATRKAIADAMRAHAAQSVTAADAIDPPPEPAEEPSP